MMAGGDRGAQASLPPSCSTPACQVVLLHLLHMSALTLASLCGTAAPVAEGLRWVGRWLLGSWVTSSSATGFMTPISMCNQLSSWQSNTIGTFEKNYTLTRCGPPMFGPQQA